MQMLPSFKNREDYILIANMIFVTDIEKLTSLCYNFNKFMILTKDIF